MNGRTWFCTRPQLIQQFGNSCFLPLLNEETNNIVRLSRGGEREEK